MFIFITAWESLFLLLFFFENYRLTIHFRMGWRQNPVREKGTSKMHRFWMCLIWTMYRQWTKPQGDWLAQSDRRRKWGWEKGKGWTTINGKDSKITKNMWINVQSHNGLKSPYLREWQELKRVILPRASKVLLE